MCGKNFTPSILFIVFFENVLPLLTQSPFSMHKNGHMKLEDSPAWRKSTRHARVSVISSRKGEIVFPFLRAWIAEIDIPRWFRQHWHGNGRGVWRNGEKRDGLGGWIWKKMKTDDMRTKAEILLRMSFFRWPIYLRWYITVYNSGNPKNYITGAKNSRWMGKVLLN